MLAFPEKYLPGEPTGERWAYGVFPKPDWKEFCAGKEQALLFMRGTQLGARLLGDIEESKLTVEVMYGKKSNSAGLTNPAHADKACYLEVTDEKQLQKTLQKLLRDPVLSQSPSVANAKRKLAAANIVIPHAPIAEIEVPPLNLTLLQRGKVAYWIMEHLTPGPGADAWVSWQHDMTDLSSAFAKDAVLPGWAKRPPWVALAHELIHAWRKVSGRVVFHPTLEEYYEEAMTVGLPPYDRCPLTENRFREAAKEPRRGFYGPSTEAKSAKAALKHPAIV
jgi:Effector protein